VGRNISWIGRFAPVKGADVAIKLANSLKEKLSLAGQERTTDYFTKKIMPEVKKSKFVEFVGPVDGKRRSQIIGESKFFINPISWEEPFGLVVPEANACGTPVIAYNRGAMSELIKDGYNGYLVKPGDFNGLIKAAEKLYEMPQSEYRQMRNYCRKHVEENFTVEKMVDGYEEVYQKIIAEFIG
jgi:glycosyltransferase involved in cell wall biosynthesis